MKQRLLFILLLALATSMAVSAQDVKELYQQGKALYDAKQYDKAFPILKTAASKGHKKAQYRVGRCYAKGRGVEKDKKAAFQWYAKSAKQDYAKAQYALGKCYLKGKGTLADKKQAKAWLTKAVKNEKGGAEILQEIKEKAKAGEEDAKAILQLIE